MIIYKEDVLNDLQFYKRKCKENNIKFYVDNFINHYCKKYGLPRYKYDKQIREIIRGDKL